MTGNHGSNNNMGIYLSHNDTQFQVGDIVKVHQSIKEGTKERTQIFEGLVIKVRGHQGSKSFTVRKISSGVGVEKIFPVDSPFVEKVEVTRKGTVRRSKLYYLRDRTGRSALKVKERRDIVTKEPKGNNDAKRSATKKIKPKKETKPKADSGKERGSDSAKKAAK